MDLFVKDNKHRARKRISGNLNVFEDSTVRNDTVEKKVKLSNLTTKSFESKVKDVLEQSAKSF